MTTQHDTTISSVLITGANSGLGKESARQLALLEGTERILLGCRNRARAEAAKAELEAATGRSIFEIVLMDVSQPESVRAAVAGLTEPIEGLIMNAGGGGGKEPGARTADGVTNLFAVNVLGHVVLLEELLATRKLTKVAVYAGSEAARGIKGMGMKRPSFSTASADEFATVIDGSAFAGADNPLEGYGPVKFMGAMWMASLARKHPEVRLVTMSPGATTGTNMMSDAPAVVRIMMSTLGKVFLPLFGVMHRLDVGARRYVDALTDERFETGRFYASEGPGATGKLVDQATIFADLGDRTFQDNANEAIHRFVR